MATIDNENAKTGIKREKIIIVYTLKDIKVTSPDRRYVAPQIIITLL